MNFIPSINVEIHYTSNGFIRWKINSPWFLVISTNSRDWWASKHRNEIFHLHFILNTDIELYHIVSGCKSWTVLNVLKIFSIENDPSCGKSKLSCSHWAASALLAKYEIFWRRTCKISWWQWYTIPFKQWNYETNRFSSREKMILFLLKRKDCHLAFVW